eukprot:13378746-Alexandrium_andersonii.AAC.1
MNTSHARRHFGQKGAARSPSLFWNLRALLFVKSSSSATSTKSIMCLTCPTSPIAIDMGKSVTFAAPARSSRASGFLSCGGILRALAREHAFSNVTAPCGNSKERAMASAAPA